MVLDMAGVEVCLSIFLFQSFAAGMVCLPQDSLEEEFRVALTAAVPVEEKVDSRSLSEPKYHPNFHVFLILHVVLFQANSSNLLTVYIS